jgi:hypothetical protein
MDPQTKPTTLAGNYTFSLRPTPCVNVLSGRETEAAGGSTL